jgi:hypothetical protein
LIPGELQGVSMPDSDIARAIAMTKPTNQKVREAADTRLRFEDEPAGYLAFLQQNSDA